MFMSAFILSIFGFAIVRTPARSLAPRTGCSEIPLVRACNRPRRLLPTDRPFVNRNVDAEG